MGSRQRDEAVTVRDPAGRALVIPTWMLGPDAALMEIAPHAIISGRALSSVATLVTSQLENIAPARAGASLCPAGHDDLTAGGGRQS